MIRSLLVVSVLAAPVFANPETVTRDGVRYFVWKAKPENVRVVWKDDAGKQLPDLPAARAYLDGVISQMRSGDGLKKPTGGFGSVIAVVEDAKK